MATLPTVTAATVPILDAATIVHEKRASTDSAASTASSATTAPSITLAITNSVSPVPDVSGVRVVAPHEYREAAACLAEAFRHDQVVRYAIDTPETQHLSEAQRYEIHRTAMELVTYAHCLNGLVLTTGPNYACVALWLPPGKNIDDWWTILRSGMWRLTFLLSKEGRTRFFDEFLPLLGRTKAEVLGERDAKSWYLNYVGTKPEGRGQGYARKLITYVTRMADADGIPCYLESSHDINLKIYSKMGFELKKQIFLERAEKRHRMDVMVREPVIAGAEKDGGASGAESG